MFWSSHSSLPTMIPSPQVPVQVDGSPTQFHPASTVQVEEQPSSLFVFPSSHSSVPTMTPSPQPGVQVDGSPEQIHPASTVQVEEQPSPAA